MLEEWERFYIRQSKGDVTIESEPGKGTTVRILLLAAFKEINAVDEAPPMKVARDHVVKILLDEDNPDVRASTALLLKALGYEVVEAETAEPVFGILRQNNSFQIVCIDDALPGVGNPINPPTGCAFHPRTTVAGGKDCRLAVLAPTSAWLGMPSR